jgi:hypothetical protein
MTRRKDTWIVRPVGVGIHIDTTPIGNRQHGFKVHVSVNLPREPDRAVTMPLTPDQADELADALKRQAAIARKRNGN